MSVMCGEIFSAGFRNGNASRVSGLWSLGKSNHTEYRDTEEEQGELAADERGLTRGSKEQLLCVRTHTSRNAGERAGRSLG